MVRHPLHLAALAIGLAAHVSSAQVTDRERISGALADLGPRFAQEFALRPGWYRDTAIRYYDFGPIAAGVGDVYWPIHGFGIGGEPVPLRGQIPVFATIPGLDGYTGLWRLHYVVVADHVRPNELRSVSAITRLVRQKRAVLRDPNAILNLPIVPRGSFLELRKDSAPAHGWFEGNAVAYMDFGPVALTPAPIFPFFRRAVGGAQPAMLDGQRNVVDVVPDGSRASVDLWDVHRVFVDASHSANTVRSLLALRAAETAGNLRVTTAGSIRNCPVAIVGERVVMRARSPFLRFALTRAPSS